MDDGNDAATAVATAVATDDDSYDLNNENEFVNG